MALASVFVGLVGISLYSLSKADSTLLGIEVAASIPLNLMTAISFLTRGPARETTRRDEVLIPTVSLVLPFIAMNSHVLIATPYSLPEGLVLAVGGAMLGAASFAYLRRSFAIMPAVRKVVCGGPYRMVRHPLYLGEFLYALGMVLLAFSLFSLALILASAIFMIVRIGIEERKLRGYREYTSYEQRVRYRLIPYIY